MRPKRLHFNKAMEFASLVGKCSANPELMTPTKYIMRKLVASYENHHRI
jgi:hypothetical protein